MEKPSHHILVCCGFRASKDAAPGACQKKGAIDYLPYIESELADRGLSDVNVSMTGCLNLCDRGPIVVVYPENVWYGGIDSEDAVDAILDAIEDGGTAEDYVLS